MKLIYGDVFQGKPTPQELKEKMFKYLDRIQEENKGFEIYECENCGKRFRLDEPLTCCEDRKIMHRYMDVPAGDVLRPSKYGFCAYSGITSDKLKKLTDSTDEYQIIMKWFFDVLQADVEQILLNPNSKQVGGAKFVAINNYGWVDKTETENTSVEKVFFVNDIPEDDNL